MCVYVLLVDGSGHNVQRMDEEVIYFFHSETSIVFALCNEIYILLFEWLQLAGKHVRRSGRISAW